MRVYVILSIISLAWAMPAAKDGVMERFVSTLRDCLETDTMLCLKEKAMKVSENLAASKELHLFDGVTFSGTGSPRSARSYDPLPEEPKAREMQVEERIMDNIVDFLDSHVLQLRMPKSLIEEDAIEEEEGRGKKKKIKKKLKKLLPLLAILKLKLAALVPIFLGIIAFAAIKAVLIGKIAILAKLAMAIKQLLDSKKNMGGGGGGGWAEPQQEEHGWESGGGGGGWGRSQDAQKMAYSAHIKHA